MVAFHARLDYLSQNLLKEVFVRRAKLFAISLAEIGKLDLKDRSQVYTSLNFHHFCLHYKQTLAMN